MFKLFIQCLAVCVPASCKEPCTPPDKHEQTSEVSQTLWVLNCKIRSESSVTRKPFKPVRANLTNMNRIVGSIANVSFKAKRPAAALSATASALLIAFVLLLLCKLLVSGASLSAHC